MIELKNCIFYRNNNFTLNINSLIINNESTTYLVGASGSGKTSLLRILSGLENEFLGEYKIDNICKKELKDLRYRNIMYLSQELFLWEHLSVVEHINFVLNKGTSLKTNDESNYYLEIVNLTLKMNSNISELSTGERQRLALARALSSKAKYLFLDEPFSSIDLVLAHELNNIIFKQQKLNKFSIITSTHNDIGLKNNNSKIIILANGKIIEQGTWNDILNNSKNKWVEKWLKLI